MAFLFSYFATVYVDRAATMADPSPKRLKPMGASVRDTAAWRALAVHFAGSGGHVDLRRAFAADPDRFQTFSRSLMVGDDDDQILFDFSKNLITPETLELLLALATEAQVESGRDAMFRGDKINVYVGHWRWRIH